MESNIMLVRLWSGDLFKCIGGGVVGSDGGDGSGGFIGFWVDDDVLGGIGGGLFLNRFSTSFGSSKDVLSMELELFWFFWFESLIPGLKSFPKTMAQPDDNIEDEEEHDADDRTDVWDVTSVLESDFEEPNAWSVLDVDNSLLFVKVSCWVELLVLSWCVDTLKTELSENSEARLNVPLALEVTHLATCPSYRFRRVPESTPLQLLLPTIKWIII